MLRSRLPEVALCLAVSLLVVIIIVKVGMIVKLGIVKMGMITKLGIVKLGIVAAGDDYHCQVGQVGCRQFQH